MEKSVVQEIFKDVNLNEAHAGIVEKKLKILNIPKGRIILSAGELVPYQYYVDSGCLRTYYLDVPTPERVSVLYVDIPEMQGGNLILYNDDKFVAKIKPEVNKLLYFRGDLKHEVTEVREMTSENIKYRLSIVCEQYALGKTALSHIPDFLIRSDTSFSNFLKNEI